MVRNYDGEEFCVCVWVTMMVTYYDGEKLWWWVTMMVRNYVGE